LGQATVLNDEDCKKITASLNLFHTHKQAILDANARRGKNGPLNHWYIPKLEFFQSVVPHIQYNGVPIQWFADYTEHAHISIVKEPARSSNNQGYEAQICRHLDRIDKIANFNLATAIRESGVDFRGTSYDDIDQEDEENDHDDVEDEDQDEDGGSRVTSTSDLLCLLHTLTGFKSGPKRGITDYFYRADLVRRGLLTASSLLPHRTHQSTTNVVFHLNRGPSLRRQPIDNIARLFGIGDLRPAIADFISRLRLKSSAIDDKDKGHINIIGGRRGAAQNCTLPIEQVEVWETMKLQTTSYHYPHSILPPRTIHAQPPSEQSDWPNGRFDPVVVNVDVSKEWPKSGISGTSLYL
jgi:hypothetical protein